MGTRGAMWGWAKGAVDGLCPAMRAASSRATLRAAPAAVFAQQPDSCGLWKTKLGALNVRMPIAQMCVARWGAAGCGKARAMSSSPAASEGGRVFTPATAFAVAEVGGKQYKVTVDDSIVTENMIGRQVGTPAACPHLCTHHLAVPSVYANSANALVTHVFLLEQVRLLCSIR